MVATRRAFDDGPLPSQIVVDSSFIFEALIDSQVGDGRHLGCRRFLRRLAENDTLLVYSELVYVEAPQCWRRLWRRGVLEDRVPNVRPIEERRSGAFVAATSRLRRLLESSRGFAAPLGPELADIAANVSGYYNLGAQDAYLVALSEFLHIPDLVTLDRDFRRVDGLVVWSP